MMYSRETQCAGKHGWRKRGHAIRAMRQQQSWKGGDQRSSRPLNVYRCNHCRMFHIGHVTVHSQIQQQKEANP